MEREALIAGVPFDDVDDLTDLEIGVIARAYRERQRREHQALAVIEHTHAILIGHVISPNGHVPAVYEAFPFWTREETEEMKVAKYRAIMERHAAAKRKRGEPNA